MRKDRPRSEVLIAVFPEIQVFWDVKLRWHDTKSPNTWFFRWLTYFMGTDFVKHYSKCLFNLISIYLYVSQNILFFISEYMPYCNKLLS